MRNLNITRAEATERSALLQVTSYDVHLDVSRMQDRELTTFGTRSTIAFEATPGGATWIDIVADSVASATLNGEPLDVAGYDGARIAVTGLAATNTLVVEAKGIYSITGEGLHRFFDPVDGACYLYSQCESADARRVYACFDTPSTKASFAFTVETPADVTVISNSTTPTPSVDDGAWTWRFGPTARVSTYITAVIVGPYHGVQDVYDGPHGSYPLGIYCRQSLAQYLDAEEIFTVTKQGFELFERAFDYPYPFVKYDQIFVPEYNAGAMENAGAVTITEDYIFRSRVTRAWYDSRANTVLHELAHMWFGDLVTMTWWDDLWLNESFAEWAAHWAAAQATQYTEAWTTFNSQRKNWGYRQDQLPSTHPIVGDMVDLATVAVNFDGITYAKGASALRQLVAWVGEKEFLAGVQAYFKAHAWGSTTLADLLRELEVSSGRDLRAWSQVWLETSGVNLLRPVIDLDGEGRYASVAVRQEPPRSPRGVTPTLRPHRIAIGLYTESSGRLDLTTRVEIDVEGDLTVVAQLAGLPVADLLVLNDGDLTFAKIRLDDSSLATAVRDFAKLDDSLTRALVLSAAWDMTRDAEMSTGDFARLALQAVASEPTVGVASQVLMQAGLAVEQYAAPEHRDDYRDFVFDAVHDLMATTDPGSDRQLALAHSAISQARTPGQGAVLGSWLDGTDVPEGLVVDTDLRWSLLIRLVALGLRGHGDIEAQLASDDTAKGRELSAAALAAIPDAANKESTFAAIVEDRTTPNQTLHEMLRGFSQPDQRELIRPFLPRYLDALPGLWEATSHETASSITLGLFPAMFPDDDVVDALDVFLARDDLATPLHRMITEGRDGLLRAQRARAFDAN